VEEIRFIYIMGRGHSGSTALDGLLGNARDCFGAGELIPGLEPDIPLCSCGETIETCPFWQPIKTRLCDPDPTRWRPLITNLIAQATIRRFLRTFWMRFDDPQKRSLVDDNRALLEAIAEQANARSVVDSTKEITRGLFLARFLPSSRIIHLVRHPESTAESLVRRMNIGTGYKFQGTRYFNQSLTPLFVAMMSATWTIGNLLCEIVRWTAPDRVMRVEYETLAADPVTTLERVCRFLELDGTEMIGRVERGETLAMGHKIGGNGMRMQHEFRFHAATTSTNAQGTDSDRGLPPLYRWICRLLTWPLLWRYGYLWSASPVGTRAGSS